jgi:ParB-like chromosome segregation protein Spo0J
MIVEQLRPLAIDIEAISYDPTNARKHDEKNLETIKSSFVKFGQRSPIVCQKTEGGIIVRAGNGRLRAAKELGWKEIAAVVIEEDNVTATGYSILDNRSGELSEWDQDILKDLMVSLKEEDIDLEEIGFDVKDLEQLDFDLSLDTIADPESKEDGNKDKKLKVCPECGHNF